MQLSLSAFLFEDGYKTMSLDFETFAGLARDLGCDGIELRRTQVNEDTPAETVRRYRSIAEDQGLAVTCMTPRGMPAGGPDRDRFFDAYLDLAGRMGCRLLKVAGDPGWLRAAAGRAAQADIALAANTHVHSPTETVAGAQALIEDVGHPNFGILYDCMHLCVAGENYLGALDPLRPHLRGVLVQCLKSAAEGDAETAISFQGKRYVKTCMDDAPVQNWPAVFRELHRIGYDGWITIIENGWPPDARRDIARRTVARIRELWEQTCIL